MAKPDWNDLKSQVWLADGAWATELHARGVPAGQAAELACLQQPGLVTKLAGDYLSAGALLLTTNTFSANRLMMQRRRIEGDFAAINRQAVTLAREAIQGAGADALLVGSIGPSGRILAVREAPESELQRNVTEQAGVLLDAGVDALVFETFSELAELLLAVEAVRELCRLPVIACMSFDSGPQRTRTLMGAEAADAAAALTTRGADLIGCNCGSGVDDALPAVVALKANTDKPIWVKPSVGLPELEDGRPVYRQTPDDFAAPFARLIEAGANVVGGCCGAGPEHIRRLGAVIHSLTRPRKR